MARIFSVEDGLVIGRESRICAAFIVRVTLLVDCEIEEWGEDRDLLDIVL